MSFATIKRTPRHLLVHRWISLYRETVCWAYWKSTIRTWIVLKHWYTILVGYNLWSGCLGEIYSHHYLLHNMWDCILSADLFLFDDCGIVCTPCYYHDHHYHIGNKFIDHCFGLGYDTMIWAAYHTLFWCMIFTYYPSASPFRLNNKAVAYN